MGGLPWIGRITVKFEKGVARVCLRRKGKREKSRKNQKPYPDPKISNM